MHKSMTYYSKIILTYIVILLIPIVLIQTVNYVVIRRNTFKTLEKDISMESLRQIEYVQQQMCTINSIAYDCKYKKAYSTLYQENPPSSFFDIIRDLKEKLAYAPFLSGIYFYNPKEEIILGSTDQYSSSYFFDKVVVLENKTLQTEFANCDFFATKTLIDNQTKTGVAIVVSLERLRTNPDSQGTYLIFTISDEDMEDLWVSTSFSQDSIGVLELNGRPVYSNNADYNRMLLTDTNINSLYEQPGYLHYDYKGDTGIRVRWAVSQKKHNQILLQFLFWQMILSMAVFGIGFTAAYYFAQRNYRPLRKLVQKASQNIGEPSALQDEIQYMNMVYNDLFHSKELYREINQDLERTKDLYRLFSGQMDDFIENHGILQLNHKGFICVLMNDVLENQTIYKYLELELPEAKGTDVYSLYLDNQKYVFLICTETPDTVEINLRSFLEQSADIGIGEIATSTATIADSYMSAKKRLNLLKETNGNSHTVDYPIEDIVIFRESVEEENLEEAGFYFNSLLQTISESDERMTAVIGWDMMKILVTSWKTSVGTFVAYRNTNELLNFLKTEFQCFTDNVRREEVEQRSAYRKKNVAEIVQYIEEHYTDNNFSLKAIAFDFGMTPSNLSHFFRNSTGQNISQYIENIRMEKAKEFLRDGIKIGEIALQLGYSSPSAFIGVFKRTQGITPGVYREKEDKSNSSRL